MKSEFFLSLSSFVTFFIVFDTNFSGHPVVNKFTRFFVTFFFRVCFQVAHIIYTQTLNEKASRHDVLNVTKNGIITTRKHYGHSTILAEAIEDNELVNRVLVWVEVR